MMNFLCVQLSPEMPIAQDGGKTTLLIPQVKKLSLSHHHLDMRKLLISLFLLQKTPCHALNLYFVLTEMQFLNMELILPSIMNAIIISFIISFKVNIRVPLPPIDREV